MGAVWQWQQHSVIGFAAALGGLALAALLVPIVIHLIRRQVVRELPFAALDWLSSHTPPRRQWRLDDRVLLAVRLLLLAALAALLAEPYWQTQGDPQQRSIHVMPGIDAAAARAAVDAPLADWHWLAVGAPSLDAPAPPADPLAFHSLIRALDRSLPAATRLTVVVPDELAGLDGERLRLGREVDWQVLPTSADVTPEPAAVSPLRIAIRMSADSAAASTVARALVAAWRTAGIAITVDDAAVGSPLADDCQLLITASPLLDAATASRVAGGLTVLSGAGDVTPETERDEVVLRDADGQPLLLRHRSGSGRQFRLAGPLDPVAWPPLRDPQLPSRLLPLLQPPSPPPDRARAASVRPLRAAFDSRGPVLPLAPWLLPAIAALALLERLLAHRDRRVGR